MFPLDSEWLMFLKLVVVITCIFFWIRLGYRALMRDQWIRRHHRHRQYDEDDN